jgi:hypothetical protein
MLNSMQEAFKKLGLFQPGETKEVADNSPHESERPKMGVNAFGRRQFFLDGKCVCARCGEPYTNAILGDECDVCQIEQERQIDYF